jgi:hypothetical protein
VQRSNKRELKAKLVVALHLAANGAKIRSIPADINLVCACIA